MIVRSLLWPSLVVALVLRSVLGYDRCHCSHRVVHLNLAEPRRIIFSPDFPRPYCGSLDCLWTVEAPSNHSIIRFHAKKIDLRRRGDSIRFYAPEDVQRNAHLKRWHDDNAIHVCTGRGECEYSAAGSKLVLRWSLLETPYFLQATLTLFHNELHELVAEPSLDDPGTDTLVSAWNFFVWVILVFCAIAFILAVVYLACLKRSREENRSPLLGKGGLDDPHRSIHSALDSLESISIQSDFK